MSRDGSYWNVNSGGVFRKNYSNKKETVAKTEPQQPNNTVSDGSSLSSDEDGGITSSEPNGEPTASESKVENNSSPVQEKGSENVSSSAKEQSRQRVEDALSELNIDKSNVHVVTDASELPKEEGQAYMAIKRGLVVEGWYNPNTGEVYLYAPNLHSVERAREVVLHELVSHKGLRGLLGAERFDALCDAVWEGMDQDVRHRMIAYVLYQDENAVVSYVDYAKAISTPSVVRAAADEYMAHLSEGGINGGAWERFMALLREVLRKAGFDVKMNDADIRRLLRESYGALTNDGHKMTPRNSTVDDVLYSIASSSGKHISIDDRVSQRAYLLGGNYVSRLTGDEFAKSDNPLTERVSKYYEDEFGGKVEREGVGTVLLDERSVKDSIAHGIGRNKAVAFAAVPDIISDGAIIDRHENWKGRGYGSVTFAAPVEIADEGYVGVVIAKELLDPRNGSHRFYLHEVGLQKNLLSKEFKTGMDTGSKQGDIAKLLKEIVSANESGENVRFSIMVNHNSPYLLKKADGSFVDPDTGERLGFDHRFMNSGEGGQAHGWGSYFSKNDLRAYAGVSMATYNGVSDSILLGRTYTANERYAIDSVLSALNRSEGKRDIKEIIEEEKDSWASSEYIEKDEVISALDKLNPDDFVLPERHHYDVEIPDDTGENYLDENKTLPKRMRRRIAGVVRNLDGTPSQSVMYEDYANGWDSLADMIERNQWAYYEIRDRLGQALGGRIENGQRLSELMSSAGFVGIRYYGRMDGECYVIFDENDAKIVDHVRFSVANKKSGMDALKKIADGEDVVVDAMRRDDLIQYGGDNKISFYYGKIGDPNKNYKGGYGIAHIGAKQGVDAVIRAIDIIADGNIDRYVNGNKTIVLTDGEYEVVLALTRFGNKETWLFNGWKKTENAGENGEVSTASASTQTNPTFSREDLGAALSATKIDNNTDSANKSVENRDKEYADAVERGDMEKVDAMLREEMKRKGYASDSDYQGSLAFNGAAPSANAYYETREERKKAFDEGEFQGDYSLGDFMESGLDNHDLEWQLANPIPASGRDKATLASIRNLSDVVNGKKRTIKMYRAVDADIKEDSFRNGDWVTPSREYAKEHIELQDWKKGRVIEQEVPVDDIWWNGDDINEWGYDDGKGYAYKNTPNNRKLLEPTYDDAGNLIPLSERFNEGQDDIRFSVAAHKDAQFEIIQENNPADDEGRSFHTWIRSVDDILTYEEALASEGMTADDGITPDFTKDDVRKALESGEVTVYSSKPITQGIFVTPSRMEAENYAGGKGNKVYSQRVKLDDVAWIDPVQGQYAKDVDGNYSYLPVEEDVRFSFRRYGGNSGYVGYSKSRRAVDAEGRGLRNKSQMDKSFADEVNALIQVKVPGAPKVTLKQIKSSLADIRYDEWHHTSMYGNKTYYYSAETIADYFMPLTDEERAEEVRRESLNAERKSLYEQIRDIVTDNIPHKEIDYWLENDYKREFPQHGNVFVAVNGDMVVIHADVLEDSDTIDLIPSGKDEAKRPYGDWQYENTDRVEHARDEFNTAKAAAREAIPQELKDKYRDVLRQLAGIRFSIANNNQDMFSIADTNKRFNEELDMLTEDNADSKILVLGNPSSVLLSAGIKDKPLKLYGSKLKAKAKQHGFSYNELRDLPNAVATPIAVFEGSVDGSHAILTELKLGGNNVLVSLSLGKDNDVDFNIVSSVYGKNGKGVVDWINKGKLLYVDKEKARDYLRTSAPIADASSNQELYSATKVIDDFVNPKLSGENVRFSIANQNQEIFVSNASRAVEGIKQEKATPEQWLKMIEKQGGLKAGEDKWLGLSDWLKASPEKSLTKQEVLDFIRDNAIQIEEVNYAYAEKAIDAPHKYFEDVEHGDLGFTYEAYDEMERRYGLTIGDKYDYWPNEMFRFEGDEENKLNLAKKVNDKAHFVDESYYDLDDEYDAGLFVEEVEYGIMHDIDDWIQAEAEEVDDETNAINSTRLQYTTKGLENKREIALVVPTIEPWNESDQIHFGDAGNGRAVAWVRFGETTDADGNRVLVIDEIQSKRHQEGREKGYKSQESAKTRRETYREFERVEKELEQKYEHFAEAESDKEIKSILSDEEWRTYESIRQEYLDAVQEEYEYKNRIPDAPFEKNWHELSMKRMLRYAAENGFDKVAWTKGEQQAERYDLGRTVQKISSGKWDKWNEDDVETKYISIDTTRGDTLNFEVDRNGIVTKVESEAERFGVKIGSQLSDIVGKDLSKELLLEEPKFLRDKDLRIGGEGMKGFYDQMLPRFMDKYGKKWGVKTHDIELSNVGEDGLTMHAVDVTPEMRDSVMEGQVMFSIAQTNERFNEELQQQIDGTLPKGHVYQLGMPSDILRSTGIPNLPIELVASRLVDKSMQDNHPFNLSEVKDFPIAIQEPLAVFRSATHIGSFVILTSLKHGNRNYIAAIETNRRVGRMLVNSIRSIHYRTALNIVNWINDKLGEYYNPNFKTDWLDVQKNELRSKPQYNSADVRTKFNTAAKVIDDFVNPKLSGENVRFSIAPLNADAREVYDKRMDMRRNRIKEAWQDSMVSVDEAQKAILAERGETAADLRDDEDAYTFENRMHGMSRNEAEYFDEILYHPLLERIDAVVQATGWSYQDVMDYMMAKHGLERNSVMAEREARKEATDEHGNLDPIAYARALTRNLNNDYAGLTGMFGVDDVRTAERMAQDMVDSLERVAPDEVEAMWKATNACTRWTLRKAFHSGDMTLEQYRSVRNMFEYYVPLRGWEETNAHEMITLIILH